MLEIVLMVAVRPGTPGPHDVLFRLVWIIPMLAFIVGAPLILRYLGKEPEADEFDEFDDELIED